MLLLFVGGLFATYTIFNMVPSSFVPQEDEGYLMCIVQAPAGASLEYTTEIAKQAEQIIYADKDVAAAFAVMGFSFSGAAPNNGMIFIRLKDYEERRNPDQSLEAVLQRLSGPLFMIPGAIVAAFPPPSIQGLSRFGGFQFEVLDQTGSSDINTLADATFGLMGAANQSGQVQGAFSSFRADDPQLIVDIDRDKARSLGLPLREVTDALQVFLGSQYVNDFDFNNRAYRVYVQADQRFRASPSNLKQLYARASNGDMVPLDSVVRLRETTAPQVISHYNLFRSAEITGNPAPGRSSGQTLDAMEELARANLPAGYDFAWSGQSLEERLAGGQSGLIFGLSLLLVYLVLSAQYESFVLPLIILLGVPLAVFGALSAQLLPRLQQRRVLPGRAGAARRPRGEELDPDRGVRRAAARARTVDRRCGDRVGAHPPAADPDDVVRLHPRRHAAGVRDRRRRGIAQLRRHRGRGRHAGLDVPVDRLHSGALRRDSVAVPGPRSSRSSGGERLTRVTRVTRVCGCSGGNWHPVSDRLDGVGAGLCPSPQARAAAKSLPSRPSRSTKPSRAPSKRILRSRSRRRTSCDPRRCCSRRARKPCRASP